MIKLVISLRKIWFSANYEGGIDLFFRYFHSTHRIRMLKAHWHISVLIIIFKPGYGQMFYYVKVT